MAITLEDAMKRCGADGGEPDEAEVMRCLVLANTLVSDVVSQAWTPVPEGVEDECVLRTLYNLYSQTYAGERGNVGADGYFVPAIANDPLRKSREMLAVYLPRV